MKVKRCGRWPQLCGSALDRHRLEIGLSADRLGWLLTGKRWNVSG